MFEKEIVVDGRGHMLGRLASIVAKQLLSGQKVTVVRCEEIVVTGSLVRNKVKFAQFLNKRTNTNPKRGPIHFRCPSKIFWRTVRGMLPHKTVRGKAAMARLQVTEGIPFPHSEKKRMVVPDALRVLRLKPQRKFTVLGTLAGEVGWGKGDLIARLEAKRKIKSEAFYVQKKAKAVLKAKAEAAADLSSVTPVLSQFGY